MRIRTVLTVAAPAAVTLALAGSAAALPAGGAAGARGARIGGARSAATHSRRFAGWEVHGTASSFSMNAVIDVPALKCGKADRAIVPGVGGYYGTGRADFSEAGLFVGCDGGKAHYWTFFVLNGADVSYPRLKVKPTDTVIFTATLNSTQTTLSVDDKSKNVNTTITGPGVARTRNPWVGDSGWSSSSGSLEGVPHFGKITFTGIFFNNTELGTHAGLIKYDRYKGSTLQLATGPLANDETFSTVFKHF
jgi:hypothetical protein